MNFDPSQFKAFAAIQNQDANVSTVVQDTVSRIAALQHPRRVLEYRRFDPQGVHRQRRWHGRSPHAVDPASRQRD